MLSLAGAWVSDISLLRSGGRGIDSGSYEHPAPMELSDLWFRLEFNAWCCVITSVDKDR